jgi:hypothetical protein
MYLKKSIVAMVFFMCVYTPIEAGFFAPLASAFGSSLIKSKGKEMFKDAIDFSDIMERMTVINEDTRDRVSELLEHTQIMDEGDTFINFAIDYAYNANPYIYVVDYELQHASEIVSKYVGKNYYDEVSISMKKLIDKLEDSQRGLDDVVPSHNTNPELATDYSNYSNLKGEGLVKANLKLQHRKTQLIEQLAKYQIAIADQTLELNNRGKAKILEEEIKDQSQKEKTKEALYYSGKKPKKKTDFRSMGDRINRGKRKSPIENVFIAFTGLLR